MNKQFKIWPVLRDVILVTVLSCLGGFIVGFASTSGHNSPLYIYSLALSNSLFCIIGFTISGCLAADNRWRHLILVAVIVWAVSIFNVIFFEFTIIKWVASAIGVALFALIGGGISLLFKRKNLVETSTTAGNDKFYDEVARELQEKTLVAGLWTKVYAEMGGDDAKARALYIKYRAAQLAEASHQRPEEQAEPSRPPKPDRQLTDAPTKSKTGIILAVLAGVIIVIVILANSGSDSTSTTKSSSSGNEGQPGGTGSGYTPTPVYAPPICKALDEKNGFKDFKFGMTPEEAREIIPPTDTATNLGPNNTIFIYANTPANRIGDFSFAVLRLCFYEDRLYRIELHFDKFQNEILEAFKANFGGPFDADSWKMGG